MLVIRYLICLAVTMVTLIVLCNAFQAFIDWAAPTPFYEWDKDGRTILLVMSVALGFWEVLIWDMIRDNKEHRENSAFHQK